MQDWTDFVSALVNHYNGETRNGVNYPHIRYYELWNEANDSGWWHGDIPKLVSLAAVAYPIIHQDPYSQLLTPSVAGPVGTSVANSASTWMDSYLSQGGAQYADAGAYHGYLAKNSDNTVIQPFPMPEQDSTSGCTAFVDCFGSVISKATQMRAVFDQYLPGKPMLQTEGGWGNLPVPPPAPPAPPIDISNSDLQVAWLSRYYLLHAGLRSSMNLQMAAWFAWDGPTGWGVIETSPGSGSPSPAGQGYSQIYSWVVGGEMEQPCGPVAGGIWSCPITRGAGYSALAIWNTQGASQYTAAPAFTRYHCLSDASCLNGNAVSIAPGSQVTIGIKPILLESSAQVCLLYDSTKAVHAGATTPIKLQLCDANGADISSANVTLHAASVVQVSTETSSDVIDSGNANPDNDFRFDPTLGSAGGYVFNLSTTGLGTGSYVLRFSTVTGDKLVDSFVLSAPFRVK